MKNKLPTLYTNSDLATRWDISRSGVHARSKRHDDFPKPVMHVDNGRMPLYIEEDVLAYELNRGLIEKS